MQGMLPDIFASAYEESPEKKTSAIKLWGVTVDPAPGAAKKDARVSVVLMKFLRARYVLVLLSSLAFSPDVNGVPGT